MVNIDSRRGEPGRSHPDRHPGLQENLDNPHPGSRRAAVCDAYKAARRVAKGAGARSAAPR